MNIQIKTGLVLLGALLSINLAEVKVIADDKPIVIAHRGASGYRPEHTLMAYKLGMEQGADYIEPDLVMTKDGHLVARHDAYLSGSTDIADHPEFADRKRTMRGKEDWWVFDFTLDELKTLRARQPRQSRGLSYDDQETIPTIAEIIELVENEGQDSQVGLYIEMKHPAEFQALGLDPTDALLKLFETLAGKSIPVYFQCFNGDYLKSISDRTTVPLIWLIEGAPDQDTGHYVLDVALGSYGDILAGVGVYKALLVDHTGAPTNLIRDAHSLGMKVHTWTVRNDQPVPFFDSVEAELEALWGLGVDGVFADFPDTAIQARDRYVKAIANGGEDH